MTTKPKKIALNFFLKSRKEVNDCTETIRSHSLFPHGIECKNFDVRFISAHLQDGNILDMGASGSFILHNAIKLNTTGRKVGIDLSEVPAHDRAEGAEYHVGDLMKTPFKKGEFQTLTCLSVVEHAVDYNLLAKECSRLLKDGGELFMTFDYWNPKPDTSAMKLYSLDWNILDKQDVLRLIEALAKNGLNIVGDIDWSTNEAVINPKYCSPANVSYTFGLFHFVKGKYKEEMGSPREEQTIVPVVEEVVTTIARPAPSTQPQAVPKTSPRRNNNNRMRRQIIG